ncbi:trypsin-like serine peptidase [Bacillus cereus]|uniref:Serine protease n=1 Tax=Bacillus cereus (strain VD014) TaxID=1053223 RepID=A0A9W5K1W7_BACC8|nr:trypsin-like serine protease [Bacillus cereus]EJR11754.1 hypothetical protein IIA_05861 [Bacillus cereus VD014]
MPENYHDMINNTGEIIPFSNISNIDTISEAFQGDGEVSPEDSIIHNIENLPSIEEIELIAPEDVCPPDERIKIINTTEYPWRSICRLIITRDDGIVAVGTGWFNGEGTVVTAGHCVYSTELEKWHKSIIIIPGKNHNIEPYGRYISTKFWSVLGWVKHKNLEYDYGAIMLENKIGKSIGYSGFRADPNSMIEDKTIMNSGYPAGKDGNLIDTQWYMKGNIKELTEKQIKYLIDTYGGNSGGPIWLDDESYQVIGIHAYGGCPNKGTRINKEVFNNLINWKKMGES